LDLNKLTSDKMFYQIFIWSWYHTRMASGTLCNYEHKHSDWN